MTGEVDKSVSCSRQIFSGFNIPKTLTQFILKRNCGRFFTQLYMDSVDCAFVAGWSVVLSQKNALHIWTISARRLAKSVHVARDTWRICAS